MLELPTMTATATAGSGPVAEEKGDSKQQIAYNLLIELLTLDFHFPFLTTKLHQVSTRNIPLT